MRVLLSTYGTRGDVEPVVALAVRLRALGVAVRVCTPPDYEERLADAGAAVVLVGQPVHAGGRPGPGFAAELIAEQFDKVPAAVDGCDAVVSVGSVAVAAAVRSVAEKLGVPYFYATCSPIYLRSPYDPPPRPRGDGEPDMTDPRTMRDLANQGLYERFGGALTSRRAAIGLPPVENIVDYACTDRPWLAADPIVVPLRRGQEAVQTGAWFLPDERPLSAELAAFLAAGSPPVYVGFGSLHAPVDAARVAIEAVRAHGRRVILSRGWADLALVDDRGDCCAVGEANHQVLFRRVAAVVHHGGAGTTHTATRAGAPQIVIPQGMDQPYFAKRVAELGVGVAHDGPTPTVESLSGALATALAPETGARASAVAGTIRTDGATVAAELLLAAASPERAAVSV